MGDLPWIGNVPWWQRVVQGLSGAVVIPLVAGVLWGYYYRAGAILGVALATLLHVTVAVGIVTGVYWLGRALHGIGDRAVPAGRSGTGSGDRGLRGRPRRVTQE